MAKTLIIKGANFLTNKLDTVYFGEVPCTGISIDGTASISVLGGSVTLTPTVTPENTTDQVFWTSSDSSVASVVNGVVTGNNYGTATITATCGSFSASCVVTVAVTLAISKDGLIQVATIGSTLTPIASVGGVANRCISIGDSVGENHAIGTAGSPEGMSIIFPYAIPEGAKTISVACSSGLAPLIVYYNKDLKATEGDLVRDTATVVDGQTSAGGTPWSISAWEFGNKTFTIPDTAGVNSFTIGFYTKNASDYSGFDPQNPGITITFGY